MSCRITNATYNKRKNLSHVQSEAVSLAPIPQFKKIIVSLPHMILFFLNNLREISSRFPHIDSKVDE